MNGSILNRNELAPSHRTLSGIPETGAIPDHHHQSEEVPAMPGRRARIIAPSALSIILRHINSHPDPDRSRAIVLLSVKAGLRAAEIAKLDWCMVLDAKGRIGVTVEVHDQIAKKRAGRTVPTRGIAGRADTNAIIDQVRQFTAFAEDNDPYGEHDFGAIDHAGEKIFWKIDYYDLDLQCGSEDPSDQAVTARVLTIMLASEY
jgi:hypothetical protein